MTSVGTTFSISSRPATAFYESRSPIYLQIAGDLRTAIEDGYYEAGRVLPSERQLAERLGVSRDAIRDALRVLAGEGLIRTGVVAHAVSPKPVHKPVPVPGDATVTARMPTPQERQRLGIDHHTGIPVLVVHVDGRPDALYAADRIGLHFDGPSPDQPS